MQREDPYDTRVEKPVRGGAFTLARGIIRILAAVLRLGIVVLSVIVVVGLVTEPQLVFSQVTELLSSFASFDPATIVDSFQKYGVFSFGNLALCWVVLVVIDGCLDRIYAALK